MEARTNPLNNAAWFVKAGAPLQVRSAKFTHAGPTQIVIKVHAIAVNPVEWIIQYLPLIFSHLKAPFVLGHDVSGQVIEVGSNVTRFKPGDRVLGMAVGTDKRVNHSAETAFQEYVVLREGLVSEIPTRMKFEDACVLPLGLSTAACALYQKDYLALEPPTTSPASTGESLIIWGASTSVGSNAVQLAHASGYDVIATASPKNFEYVKNLGASIVFDYHSKDIIPDMIAALKGKRCAGAVAICDGSAEACIGILSAIDGRKFVAQMSAPLASSDLTTNFGRTRALLSVLRFGMNLFVKSKWNGVEVKFVIGSDLMENDVGPLIYRDFLPRALSEGKFVAAPSPTVVGAGLEQIQAALDKNRRGISASKVVVTLS